MSRPYGGRWKIRGNIGGGGQGDVFRVTDEPTSSTDEYALKRLRDVERLDRFKNEIAALKKLDHPSIVKLLDHSDLSSQTNGPHYLVMPLAAEGDAERRLPLFVGNVENVVDVGFQAAQALAAAHLARVVHRDVKPGNILFPGQGLKIWLSDFGICHLEKDIRDTPPGAVMGPRRYAAPEIEEGVSDVPFNVDVYSLGQVIFYLLSNGRTFHRENVHSPDHDAFFPAGERAAMLRVLLSRMVAPKERRVEMEQIVSSLGQLREWTSIASSNVLDDESRQLLIGLRKKVQQNDQDRVNAARAKADRDALVAAARAGIVAVMRDGLNKAAAEISEGGDLAAEVSEELVARGLRVTATMYEIKDAIRLSVSVTASATKYELYGLLCEKRVTRVQVAQVQVTEFGASKGPPASSNDMIFAIIPIFSVVEPGVSQSKYFFVTGGKRIPLERSGPDLMPNIQNRLASSSNVNVATINKITTLEFALSSWPDVQPDISGVIREFIKVFLKDVLLRQG
jgi:serine/threonine protein kinase